MENSAINPSGEGFDALPDDDKKTEGTEKSISTENVADETSEEEKVESIKDDVFDLEYQTEPKGTLSGYYNSMDKIHEKKKGEGENSYKDFSVEALVAAFKKMSKSSDWMHKGTQIQEIRSRFEYKYSQETARVKRKFIAEGGNEIDFFYKPQFKEEFDQISYEYQKKKRKYRKDLEISQKANLGRRMSLIEEIKSLIDTEENINTIYKQFRRVKESWHNTGSVPHSERNNVWQTYKYHVKRFYDFLHLNRELRELDLKRNYEERLKIVEQAEALTEHPDAVKANRDLNVLRRLWKNDLGPVTKEHWEDLWKRFQSATKIIHKRKVEFQKEIDTRLLKNLEKKNAILDEMRTMNNDLPENHLQWQKALGKSNELRETFKKIGSVPSENNRAVWREFRTLEKTFIHEKNRFYKTRKEVQKEHIAQKKRLIETLKSIINSDDWDTQAEKVKGLQKEWQVVGFIPRKINNQLWDKFKEQSTLYFDRLRSGFQKLSPEEEIVYENKKTFIDDVLRESFSEKTSGIKSRIQELTKEWKKKGVVNPKAEGQLKKELLAVLTSAINKLKIEEKDKTDLIFEMNIGIDENDTKHIDDEIKRLNTKIDAAKFKATQLENNFEFFSHSSSENHLFKEVEENRSQMQSSLKSLEERIIQLKQLKTLIRKKTEAKEVQEEPSESSEDK